ncbi:hypothetical protein BC936DRAFT_145498 [Jimgerdemannia flammicorona]|uniref:Uncharacterized protein n=1 Tax=Jimgerdemannia flammicorona TaxID=994334 RepID=A0A433D9Z3_9FUNG|nr:hypothetical protein BC936DRAFT_145498 [Jimgerdemannia flammicorona]
MARQQHIPIIPQREPISELGLFLNKQSGSSCSSLASSGRDLLDSNEEECLSRVGQRQVDPTPLSATPDVSPVDLQTSFCDFEYIILCIVEEPVVHDADMGEMKHVLRGLARWWLGGLNNRITKFQAAAKGYLVRKEPQFSRLLRKRAPKADNDLVPQLEQRMDQEAKSREAMEGRFEEVVEEVRLLQEQVDVMQEEMDLYKEKLETADTEILPQLLPQLVVVQHHASSGKPARSSKENSTPPPSNKPAHANPSIKASIDPPCSRTPRAAVPDRLAAKLNAHKVASDQTKMTTARVPSSILVSRASLREGKRTVLGSAKATTNVRSGKSTAVRKPPMWRLQSFQTTLPPSFSARGQSREKARLRRRQRDANRNEKYKEQMEEGVYHMEE